jgi:hypothetical protein
MDGTTQAQRNARELLEAKLIASAVQRRYGELWSEHPLSNWPEEIRLDCEGKPTFGYYNTETGVLRTFQIQSGRARANEPWRSEPPSILVDGFVSDAIIAMTVYDERGELLGFEVAAR